MHRYRSYNTSAFFLCFRAFERKEYIFNCYLTHIPFIVRCRFRSRIAHRLDKIKQHIFTSITTAIFVVRWLCQHTVERNLLKLKSDRTIILCLVLWTKRTSWRCVYWVWSATLYPLRLYTLFQIPEMRCFSLFFFRVSWIKSSLLNAALDASRSWWDAMMCFQDAICMPEITRLHLHML